MRLLILVLGLACLFGAASLWHLQRVGAAREELAAARELASGRTAHTEVGVVPEGWAVLVVGEPSGAEPVAAPERRDAGAPQPPPEQDAGAPAPPEPRKEQPPAPPPDLGDFEMAVQPGESLSKICKARYGSAAPDLVRALARYNELASADTLMVGQRLKLPAPEKLKRLASTRP